MKSIKMLSAFLMLSTTLFGQSIKFPLVDSAEDPTTVVTAIETNSNATIVSFKHISPSKGNWIQLNKSMYLQDAGGEERYNYIKSEGIPLRPERLVSKEDNQEVNFKVYFEKLKPGTKRINIIERARSLSELNNGVNFLNYFKVDLLQSQEESDKKNRSTQVIIAPPPPAVENTTSTPFGLGDMANFAPMMSNMYGNMLQAQLNTLSKPTVMNQIAKVTKGYYDALIKAGFSADAALKIVISKPLLSVNDGVRN
jgi:hypothetical protein